MGDTTLSGVRRWQAVMRLVALAWQVSPATCLGVVLTAVLDCVAQVGTAETDPEVRRRGLECEIDLIAGVKTNSDAGYLATKRPLCVH